VVLASELQPLNGDEDSNQENCLEVDLTDEFSGNPIAISSSAVELEMGDFSDSFGGSLRRVIMYFLGIGLGGWFTIRKTQGYTGVTRFFVYWFLPFLQAAITTGCIAFIGLPLWDEYLVSKSWVPTWVIDIANQPESPIYDGIAALAAFVWVVWFIVHLVAVFYPRLHYMMNPFQYQAALLQLMQIHPIISDLPPRLFLTDGGHIENLGLFPVLHQRCEQIIMLDAEALRHAFATQSSDSVLQLFFIRGARCRDRNQQI